MNKHTKTVPDNYQGRVFYEIYVRSFNDSNNDGIGDLQGVIQKLDYIQDLGFKGIWLMPINISPSIHGYDVTDYYKINPEYGTMEDLQELLVEAHKRDILVLLDLVLNHTSIQNEWFKEALRDKNSKYYPYYCWANENDDLDEPPLIFDKPWNQVPGTNDYYYSVFWSGMPDLNYDNPAVRAEIKNVAKFYIDIGVDGFRLDAARWLYGLDDDRAVAFWQEFNGFLKGLNKNAVLVGEICSSDPDNLDVLVPVDSTIIAKYLTGLDSCFNFVVSEQIVKGLVKKSVGSVAQSLKDAYDIYGEEGVSYIDSPFLSNHDMDRSMDRLGGSIEKAKKAAAILLTLPGTPYVYYGEEIGMTGVKPDTQIRQPLIWDHIDASLHCHWQPIVNNCEQAVISVQQKDKDSLLNFYKRFIAIRNSSSILKYGSFLPIATVNDCVMAYKRVLGNEEIYIYINATAEDKLEKINMNETELIFSNKQEGHWGEKNVLESDEILIFKLNHSKH